MAAGILLAIGLLLVKLTAAGGAPPGDCVPVLYPRAGVETVIDPRLHVVTIHKFDEVGRSTSYRIDLDQSYGHCGEAFAAFLQSLRQREAGAHALVCGQRQAYLQGRLDPKSPLKERLDFGSETYAMVEAAYKEECLEPAFRDRHHGITREAAAAEGIPR